MKVNTRHTTTVRIGKFTCFKWRWLNIFFQQNYLNSRSADFVNDILYTIVLRKMRFIKTY